MYFFYKLSIFYVINATNILYKTVCTHDIVTKYFSKGTKAEEISETIEKALALYFKNMEGN